MFGKDILGISQDVWRALPGVVGKFALGQVDKAFGIDPNSSNSASNNGLPSILGQAATGALDYSRNMEMAATEHAMSRADMQLQNAFTAEREDLAWARNQQAAQESREYDKMMSDTAIQRQVADLKAAGLNPWLAAGGSGASTGSSPTPSASSASSAGIAALQLPESKIWENTSNSMKSTLANLISLVLVGKAFL